MFRRPVISQPEFHCRTTTRPAGLTMTEQEVDELIAVGLREDGSRGRAFGPKVHDRYPHPHLLQKLGVQRRSNLAEACRQGRRRDVLSAVDDEQRRPQPGEGGVGTARLIARDDLLATLDRAAAGKVTIISASAGSGKTSLLRAWAGGPGQPRRLAVLQVQRDQQDAQPFWLALLDAVRQATGADSGAEPPAATPDFNAPAMAGRVLSKLADTRDGITLVIDDLHELNSPDALAQLSRLLTNLPPRVHAILATRP